MNHLSPLPPEIPPAGAAERSDLPASLNPPERPKPFDSHLHPEKQARTSRNQPSDEKRAEKNRGKEETARDEMAGAELGATIMVDSRIPPLPTASVTCEPAQSVPSSKTTSPEPDSAFPNAGSGVSRTQTPVLTPGADSKVEPAKNSDETKPAPIEAETRKQITNDFTLEKVLPVDPRRAGGTDAAKHRVAMPIAEPATKPTNIAAPAARVTGPSPTRDFSFSDRQGESDLPSQPRTTEPAMPLNADVSLPPSRTVETTQKTIHTEQLTRVFNEVTATIERLRTDGRTNVEVQIKLRDGEQLTVRLELHAGQVRATFKTDSSEWREAIGRGWSNFSSSFIERGVRVTTPVFESPSAQDGLNDFNQRSHNGHEQADSTASGQSLTPPPQKKNQQPILAPTTSPVQPATMPAAGLTAWA